MGLIHLYSATSTSFDGNGTPLVTAREAVVKRDEGFQLTFSIPISQNDLHKQVQKEMIVSAMTPDGVNYFRIWDIEKRTTDVKVTALQLLYSLDVKKINPFGGKQHTGDSILQAFANSFKSSISPYTFSSSILTLLDFHTNEEDDTSTSHNALAILNKIADHWSGELMLNGFDVRMVSKLGTKTDALLYEHKNIASFSDSSSMNGIVTRIYATATYTPERAEGAKEDPEPVVLTATVDSPLINQYAVIYEATMEYNDARTVAELRTEILKQYSEFNVDKPERTIDVDTNIVDGTAINFGDELVLKYLVHDVDEVIRCVGYEYDPISENYIGVTLGTLEKTFLTKVTEGISSTVSSQIDKINRDIQGIQTAANGKNRIAYGPSPVPNAIEGDLWFYHPEGRPDEVELLIYQNGLWLPAPFLTDQDKAQFEQEMADHYDAALAEVARKDAEYKEIFDDYDAKVVAIDKGISDAATKAQSALEEAGISTDLAQTAKDLATTAQTNANQAKSDASTALENANLAKTDASQAVIDANTAKTNAQTAINNASTALTNASQAKTDSQTAMTNANQAKEDASQALTNAGTAMTNAAQAKTDASQAVIDASKAVTDAQSAITKAGQAEAIANTAKTNAQTAIADAQTALTEAGIAKSTANTLSVKVDELEGEVELKASQTEVDGISGTVSTHTTTLSQQATAIASKADKTVVDTLSGTVSTQGTLITQNATDIASKASSASVNTLTGRVDTAESNISQNATAISQRVTTTTYNTGLATKEDNVLKQSTAPSHLNGRLWLDTSVAPNVLKRSTGTAWVKATPTTASEVGAYSSSQGNALAGRVTTAETTITQTSEAITSKADKSVVDALAGTVSTQGTTITQHADLIESKANQTEVDTVKGTVSGHTTTLSQHATQIASKAEKSLVDTIKGTVDTHTTEISQNATDIASKASASSVNTLTGRVDTAESNISQNATAITQRVTTTTYNSGMSSKENAVIKQSTAPTHANGKLWLDTSTTPNVLKRSNGSAWIKATPTTASEVGAYSQSDGAGLAGRLTTAETNITQTSTAITSKADKSVVDTLSGTVSTHTTTLSQQATAISSKADKSVVNTLSGTVDNHTTEIAQNATDIATKASASSVNTLTGRVDTAESNISQNATAISQRVTTTTYNSGIASKENTVLKQSAAPAHLNGRLWLDTSVTPNVLKRSTGTAWVKATPTTPGEVGAYSQSDGAGLAGRLTTAETNITQTATAITSKADKSTVDTLAGTVDTHTTEIAQNATAIASKASTSSVNTLTGRVSTAETTISQHATSIASKASQTEVDTVKGTVSGHTTTLSQHATQIASKASTSSVNTLTGIVSTAESNISQNATAISARLTSSQVNSLVDGKGFATQTWANNQITATANGIRTDLTKVEGKIDGLQIGGRNLAHTNNIRYIHGTLSSKSTENIIGRGNWFIDIQPGFLPNTTYTISNKKIINNGGSKGENLDVVIYNNEITTPVQSISRLYSGYSTTFTTSSSVKDTDRILLYVSTDPIASHFEIQEFKLEKGNKATDWTLAPEDTMDYTNTQIDIKAGQVTTSLTSLINTKATQSDIDASILNDKRIKDTRNDNQTPNWYYTNYPKQKVLEFKTATVVGINQPSTTYVLLETDVPWTGNSGGYVTQTATGSTTKWTRRGNSTIWSAWIEQADVNYVNTTVTTTANGIEQLITQVKTNPTGTITGYNSLKNNVDSMVQAIGSDGGKIAQMVMTDSLFSTKILSTVDIGGRNLFGNSTNMAIGLVASGITTSIESDGTRKFVTVSDNGNYTSIAFSNAAEAEAAFKEGDDFTVSLTIKRTQGSGKPTLYIKPGMGYSELLGDLNSEWSTLYQTRKWKKANAIAIHIGWTGTAGTFFIKNMKLEKGNVATDWTPAPEDKADQSQVTQLAGSWALTLKSGNDIKTQINASTDAIRLSSKFIHLNGSSLIDNATIKSAHIDNLNANKIVGNTADFNTIRTGVLTADAVTSTHIKADKALFDTLFSTTSATDRLSAQTAWIKDANIIGINASKITAGTISAARITTNSLDNVVIGGRNLLRQSNVRYQNNAYPVASYQLAEPILSGSIVTLSIKGSLGRQRFGIYNSGGSQFMTDIYPEHKRDGVYKLTFTWVAGTTSNTRLYIFPMPDNTASTTIEWVKLEYGNKATGWSPAPEDIVDDLGTRGSVEIHGGNIKADTLDVGAITGNKATFISTGFKSLNSQATINGHAIRIQNTAGEFVEMNNTPELRSDDAGGTAVVLGKGRVHFYDSRGYSKGYVGTDMHTAGSYDFGTFLSKGSGIYKFARMADATQTTYAYYTVKAGKTSPSPIITDMVQNGYLPDGNAQQFVAKGNMISQLNGWPNYPNWPALSAGQKIRYKELTTQTTGDAYETIWKFGPSSQGDWRIYFSKHATFEGGTTGTSDRRLKHNIETTRIEALGHIESLAFKEFRWNRDNKHEPLGLIAQDSGLLRVSDDDMEGIDIQRSIMLGLKGVQELQSIVKEQAEEIRQLKEIINQ